MIETVQNMISKFRININQIIRNSDNTIEDIESESFLVLHDFFDKIKENEKVFINELRSRCLKFNKYGKRLDNKEDWERFNRYEESLQHEYKNAMEINEDLILGIHVIKEKICEEEYSFLIHYFRYGQEETSKKYGLKEGTVRKRVHTLINKIKKELNIK
ncbi:MAG: hypothetical protein ACRC1T_09275 [Clostridium chrysemydis]|uniref:hypothetical protein n=1 Tax=Clostridium chrysemydis TaxID=2665504 RepID=UPI003F2F717C